MYKNLATGIRDLLEQSGRRVVARFLGRDGEENHPALTGLGLHRRALDLGLALRRTHVGETPVIFAMDTEPDFLAALVGCIYAGIIVVPVPIPRRFERISRLEGIARDCATDTLLCGAGCAQVRHCLDARNVTSGLKLIDMAHLGGNSSDVALPGFEQSPDAPVVIQYTSGSTREPSGVVLSSENILNNAALVRDRWNLGPDSTLVNWLPNFHDMGLMGGLLYPLINGGCSVQLSPQTVVQRPIRWLQAISRFRGTHSGGPPFAFGHCLDRILAEACAGLDLTDWAVAYCGAESVPAALLRGFRERFAGLGLRGRSVLACYGLAEATLFVAGEPDNGTLAAEDSVTATSPCKLSSVTHATLRIVDPQSLELLPDGETGEIWLQGPSVARGYWRDPRRTAEVMGATIQGVAGKWLRTGDLGRIDGDQLYITGRIKDVLIVNGVNIAATDIEWLAAQQHPELNDLAAAAFQEEPFADGRTTLLIEVRSSRSHIDDPVRLRKRIRAVVLDTLDVDLRHIAFVCRGSLDRTSSGKIKRQEVAARSRAGTLYPEIEE